MKDQRMMIAVVTEVFFDDTAKTRLSERLRDAASAGADLVVLPELPLDPWVPASREPDQGDAEPPGGPRYTILTDAARAAKVAVLGGAIVRDPADGERYNTALVVDADGELVGTYRKVHFPFEEGYWEAAHYRPGSEPPPVVRGLPLPIGLQICSDANRADGCQLLAARGAAVICYPRATPLESWPRWRMVLRANAVTTGTWVVSINRPALGSDGLVGGPSVVIAPDGEVVLETTDALALYDLDGAAVEAARAEYPGCLSYFPRVYSAGWSDAES